MLEELSMAWDVTLWAERKFVDNLRAAGKLWAVGVSSHSTMTAPAKRNPALSADSGRRRRSGTPVSWPRGE